MMDVLQFDLWFDFAVESGSCGQIVFVLYVDLVEWGLGCSH